jgi:hypothetical protein
MSKGVVTRYSDSSQLPGEEEEGVILKGPTKQKGKQK